MGKSTSRKGCADDHQYNVTSHDCRGSVTFRRCMVKSYKAEDRVIWCRQV